MASCQALLANGLSASVSPALLGDASTQLRKAACRRPAFAGGRVTQPRASMHASKPEQETVNRKQVRNNELTVPLQHCSLITENTSQLEEQISFRI